MRRLVFLFLTFFVFFTAKSQYPITQNLGSDSTLIRLGSNYGGAIKGNVVLRGYYDTTAANLVRIAQYAGSLIYTTSDNRVWRRNNTNTRWDSFATSAELSYVTGCYGLLNGGVVTWSGTGLVMNVTAAYYVINCNYYNSEGSLSVTLDAADPTNPRIDVIAVDTAQNIVVIKGTAGVNPVKPQVNPTYQVELTEIYVPAGATTPQNYTYKTVYNENTEWTSGSALTTGTANFNSTVFPSVGTKNLRVSASTVGHVYWDTIGAFLPSGYQSLSLRFSLASAPTNDIIPYIYLRENGVQVTYSLALDGFGYSSVSGINEYNVITIPMSAFTFTSGSTFDGIGLYFGGMGAIVDVDYVQLQTGTNGGGVIGNYLEGIRRLAGSTDVEGLKNGVWQYLFTDSTGGSSMTFTNGLTESGGTVKLGGTLTEQTTIDGQEPLTISISNIDGGQVIVDDGSVQINAVKNITGNSSKIKVKIDSINILPPNGNLFVDSINTVSSTTGRKVLVHDTATGKVERVDPSILGGTDTTSLSNRINQKLNITDTANIRARLYAGTNITISGTYPNLTIASTAAGGSQDLQGVTEIGDSTNKRLVTNDTVKSNNILSHGQVLIGDTAYSDKYGVYYGTSITAGQGVSASERYAALVSKIFGVKEYNRGISGSTLIDRSGTDSSMFNRIYTIPSYGSGYKFISFEYGANDAYWGLDTTTFKTKYAVIIDTAIARGWPLERIIVITAPYSIKSTVPGLQNFALAAKNIAISKGVNYVDAWTFMSSRGGTSLLQLPDSLHPSALGHYVIANAINLETRGVKKTGYVNLKGAISVTDSAYIGGNLGVGISTTGRGKLEINGSIVQDYTGGTQGFYNQYLDGSTFKWGVEFVNSTRKIIFLNKANGELATATAYQFVTGTTTSPASVLDIYRNGNVVSTGTLFQNSGDFLSNYTNATKYIGSKYLDGSSYRYGIEIVEGAGSNGLIKFQNRNSGSSATAAAFQFQTGTTTTISDVMVILRNGNVGIGVASPTSKLHVAAGGTDAGSAGFKLTTQAAGLTVVEQGAMELIGNSLQFTQLAKRRGVVMSQNVRTTNLTCDNTTTETAAIVTAEHGANYLEVGKCEVIRVVGKLSQRSNANAFIKFRIKYAGVTVDSVSTPINTTIAAGSSFELISYITCRSTGATGTAQVNTILRIDGVTNSPDSNPLVTINTTTAQDFTITAVWGEANASNLMTVNQGHITCIEPSK